MSATTASSIATCAAKAAVMRICGAPGILPASVRTASIAQRAVRGATVVSRASGMRARLFSTRLISVIDPASSSSDNKTLVMSSTSVSSG